MRPCPAAAGPFASRYRNLRALLYNGLGKYERELEAARLGQHRYLADGWYFTREVSALVGLDRPFLRGLHLYCRARILAALGDGEAAVRALEASHSRGWGFDMPELHLNYAWKPIRTHPPFQEWLKPKG